MIGKTNEENIACSAFSTNPSNKLFAEQSITIMLNGEERHTDNCIPLSII